MTCCVSLTLSCLFFIWLDLFLITCLLGKSHGFLPVYTGGNKELPRIIMTHARTLLRNLSKGVLLILFVNYSKGFPLAIQQYLKLEPLLYLDIIDQPLTKQLYYDALI